MLDKSSYLNHKTQNKSIFQSKAQSVPKYQPQPEPKPRAAPQE